MSKLHFPYFYFLHKENKNETASETYIDPEKFDWIEKIESDFSKIEQEITDFLSSNVGQFKPYFEKKIMDKPTSWQTIVFTFWGLRLNKNKLICPETFKLLNQIPGFVSLSISKLDPHSEIKPHFGDSDAIYRCHLPILVPGKLPEVGFHVGYEQRPWEKGRFMIFNDAAYHKGWNQTDNERIILIIDVIRPEYLYQKRWICSLVLGSIFSRKYLKIDFSNKKNPFLKIPVFILAPFFWFYFSVFNKKLLKID